MKASDLFLRCLEAQGVTHIYGVPGEENADLMIALLHSSIEFIICRHEQNAAFMADMHGRLTGRPGVCLATLGPGATNLITGVASANMDHVPLIAIIGQAATTRLHKISHQNMDSVAMYRPVTKWATTVRDADVIPEVIAKGFKVAVSSKPGAVLIELPEDIAKHDTAAQVITAKQEEIEAGVNAQQIHHALQLIADSKAPILLAGSGSAYYELDDELGTFIDKTHSYAAATFMGKGAIDAKGSYSLRCVGLGMKDIVVEAFNQADLVICVGYDMVEWPPCHWNEGCEKKIIHIDTVTAEVDECYMPDVELIGNMRSILNEINRNLTTNHEKSGEIFKALRQRALEDLDRYDEDESFPIKPQRMIHDLRELMRHDDILISDVGAHKMWVARQYPTYQSKTCFIYNGFCSMGGAIPAATQAKWLYPDKHVVAVIGDGGFMMSIQALVTAVQYQAPIVVLVWEDNYYGLIKWKQEAAYQQSSHVALQNPDLTQLSLAFGCHSEHIDSVATLKSALAAAFERQDKPTVLVVPVDYGENMKLTQHLGEIMSH
ncbi:MAG: acetolactate synthase large subunit [Gammaproteobacteria bacterium]|nr:acetolactate synthase large subunit [Gammaproteobacteria bacterium]